MLNAGGGLRMDINALITHYGYAALVIGSMAEEVKRNYLLRGVAAHQGFVSFRWWRRPSRWEG